VVEKANLTLALRTMKDFFLLGRGELFLVFIDKANAMLRSPPVAATQHGKCMLSKPCLTLVSLYYCILQLITVQYATVKVTDGDCMVNVVLKTIPKTFVNRVQRQLDEYCILI